MRYAVILSKDERDLILDTGSPSTELTRRLRFGISSGKRIHYELDEDVYEELLALTVTEAVRGKTRASRRKFHRLEEKLRKAVTEAFPGMTGEDLPGILPSEVKAEIQHTLIAQEYPDSRIKKPH